MYGRIVKSERILTKLCVVDYEYICDRIAKFHKKMLVITRFINIQILATKYFSFHYSVWYQEETVASWTSFENTLDVLPFSDGMPISCCEHSGTYRSVLHWSRDKSQRPVLSRYFTSSTAILPAIRGLSFQQDNTPAHRARETVHLLTHETLDFITPALWPANSPDLNPVGYQIWGKLQERVYRSQIRDVDQLKSRLIEEWEHFQQVVVDEAVRQWRPCLRACVRAHGGHFERRL